MNTLILVNQTSNKFFPLQEDGRFSTIYTSNTYGNRMFRRFVLALNLPLKGMLFRHFHQKAVAADMIILFDIRNARAILQYLKKRYPDKKSVFWYWNPVSKADSVNTINDLDIEIWSFDISDCKKYNLKYNTQIFLDKNFKRSCNSIIKPADIFYVGVDKDRAKMLSELAEILKKLEISYNFNLVRLNSRDNTFGIEYKETMTYPEVVSAIKKSKVVIDLCAEGQSGLTLRPIEALFLKKKLITNMKNITKYDIYNPKNIFVVGMDDLAYLPEFIYSDYDDSNYKELCNKYSFENWLNRFYCSEESTI